MERINWRHACMLVLHGASAFALSLNRPRRLLNLFRGASLSYSLEEVRNFPRIDLTQVAGAVVRIPLEGYDRGSTNLLETASIALLCRTFRPRVVVEIGTFEGKTTRAMFLNCPPETRIYTLDLPGDSPIQQGMTDTGLIEAGRDRPYLPRDERVKLILADSAECDLRAHLSDPVDLAFIDGSHSYDYARNDTELLLDLLSDRGVIVWHDTLPREAIDGYGVCRYLRELRRERGLRIYRVAQTGLSVYFAPGAGAEARDFLPPAGSDP